MSEQNHDRDRDDTGQFTATVTNDDILAYFGEGRPFHTAQEVADRFGLDRSTAYRRLSTLHEDGELKKVTLGSRTVVWWRVEDETASDGAESDAPEDDPLFTGPALISSGEPESSEQIDDVLYGTSEE